MEHQRGNRSMNLAHVIGAPVRGIPQPTVNIGDISGGSATAMAENTIEHTIVCPLCNDEPGRRHKCRGRGGCNGVGTIIVQQK
jgi:hypothetical protein